MSAPPALLRFVLMLGVAMALANTAASQDGHGGQALHFSHPLITESPSPDTKLRADYMFSNVAGEEAAERHTAALEAEYAFAPWLSVEASLPYTFLSPDEGASTQAFDNAEIALKYANFYFAGSGLLLGGGLELGLPTGDESEGIGSNNVLEIEPFVDFGYQRGAFETVGFGAVGFPVNSNGEDEADSELEWNLSFLVHATNRLSLLLEFDGEEVNGGEEDGVSIVNIAPGVKYTPLPDRKLNIGASVGFPLTSDQEFHTRVLVSLFQHF